MALHPEFLTSPHAILDPALRWFTADKALRESSMDKLMPPLVVEVAGRPAIGCRLQGIQRENLVYSQESLEPPMHDENL
jgi:hypothetical protein